MSPVVATPLRVLIVDDDDDWLELVQRMLQKMRLFAAQVCVAARIHDAERLLAEEGADLVLLDMNLPNGSGLDMLRSMQRIPRQTPTIMLTGVARDGDEIEAMRRGAQEFMTKDELTKVGAVGLERKIAGALAREEGTRELLRAQRKLHLGA